MKSTVAILNAVKVLNHPIIQEK